MLDLEGIFREKSKVSKNGQKFKNMTFQKISSIFFIKMGSPAKQESFSQSVLSIKPNMSK